MGFDMNKTKFFIVLSLFFFILSCILAVKLSDTEENLVKVIKDNVEESLETTENVGIEITTSEKIIFDTEEIEITTTEEIEVETEIETNVFETEEVKVAATTVMLVEEPTYTIEETIYIPTEETEIETSEEILEVTEVSIEEPAAEVSWGFTEEEIDMIANVVMHEVGGFYDTNIIITATYADDHTEIYSSSNLILQYHAQVLIN